MAAQWVFASSNVNKIRELRQLLGEGIQLLSLAEAGIVDEIPETGTTLHENACIKARYVYERLGLSCFADDSGLMVDALGGQPGVYSARYAGEPANDQRNILKLLEALGDTPNRKAQFVTVICIIHQGTIHYVEGNLPGTIAFYPKGTNGFGYDPVFIPEGSNRTLAELSAEEKNAISHRARAVRKLIPLIQQAT